ncbi:MAG: GNAT family N-acetyltransferase [bacterium]
MRECGDLRRMATLQTLRLTLRPCSPDDREDFMALERDPEVMRFLNGGLALDQYEADLDASFLMPRGDEPHLWTARWSGTGGFVGWFCLWPDSETVAELGYRLRRAEWGQGLASEGAAALVNWGFDHAGYDRIVACTMAANQGSRRVMEKIGMTHSRTEFLEWSDPIPGAEQGEVWYEMARRVLTQPG